MRIRIKRYPGSQEQVLKKERLKCRSENNTYTLYKLITVRNSIRATNTSVNAATLRKIRSIVFLGIIPILSNVAIQERRKGRWIEKNRWRTDTSLTSNKDLRKFDRRIWKQHLTLRSLFVRRTILLQRWIVRVYFRKDLGKDHTISSDKEWSASESALTRLAKVISDQEM
jgi:hypothetical protein